MDRDGDRNGNEDVAGVGEGHGLGMIIDPQVGIGWGDKGQEQSGHNAGPSWFTVFLKGDPVLRHDQQTGSLSDCTPVTADCRWVHFRRLQS